MVTRRIDTFSAQALEVVGKILAAHYAVAPDDCAKSITTTVTLSEKSSALLDMMFCDTLLKAPVPLQIQFHTPRRTWSNVPLSHMPPGSMDPQEQRQWLADALQTVEMDKSQANALLSVLLERIISEAVKERTKS